MVARINNKITVDLKNLNPLLFRAQREVELTEKYLDFLMPRVERMEDALLNDLPLDFEADEVKGIERIVDTVAKGLGAELAVWTGVKMFNGNIEDLQRVQSECPVEYRNLTAACAATNQRSDEIRHFLKSVDEYNTQPRI